MRCRRPLCCLLAFACDAAPDQGGVNWATCEKKFEPPDPGSTALALNGVRLPDTCFTSIGKHEVFIIGDWGGLASDSHHRKGPAPADHRKKGVHKRVFVKGLDDCAQLKVRDRMRERAAIARPEYILNVGDNFYWGGVEAKCGTTRLDMNFSSQWDDIYENQYTGEGLDGLQWLGVLGNHDYGGFMYRNAWDQAIMYTWKQPRGGTEGRWVTPALYWRSTVHYLDFSVDYFFLDTNVYDADDPYELDKQNHNICSYVHNSDGAEGDCGSEGGPTDLFDCHAWFKQLWEEQLDWLHLQLSNSSADWQIVVTHFPPQYDPELFGNLTVDYGIDLFVTGHWHRQEVHGDDESNFLAPTAWVVSGGGGGITSDYIPDVGGDSQYGFMSMVLSRNSIEVVNIDHTGEEGDRAVVSQRPCKNCTTAHVERNVARFEMGTQRRGKLGIAARTTAAPTTTAPPEFTAGVMFPFPGPAAAFEVGTVGRLVGMPPSTRNAACYPWLRAVALLAAAVLLAGVGLPRLRRRAGWPSLPQPDSAAPRLSVSSQPAPRDAGVEDDRRALVEDDRRALVAEEPRPA